MQLFPSMDLLSCPFCRRKIYGANLIEVPVKSYARLLVEEVCVHPQCFQRASCPRADPAPDPSLPVLCRPFLLFREEIRESRAGGGDPSGLLAQTGASQLVAEVAEHPQEYRP